MREARVDWKRVCTSLQFMEVTAHASSFYYHPCDRPIVYDHVKSPTTREPIRA